MADIVDAAISSYMSNPRVYRPHIHRNRLEHIISVRVNPRRATFFADEAFRASVRGRQNFIGHVVAFYLDQMPARALSGVFLGYIDILGPILEKETSCQRS